MAVGLASSILCLHLGNQIISHRITRATCSKVLRVPSDDQASHRILVLTHKKSSRQAAFSFDALYDRSIKRHVARLRVALKAQLRKCHPKGD